MAEALALVKREFGGDAVVLHTRTDRVGGFLGIGGQTVTEITATTHVRASASEAQDRQPQRVAPPRPRPAAGAPEQDAARDRLLALARSRGITPSPRSQDAERIAAQSGLTAGNDASDSTIEFKAATYDRSAVRRAPRETRDDAQTPDRAAAPVTSPSPVRRAARAVAETAIDRAAEPSAGERSDAVHHAELAKLGSMVEELLSAQRTQSAAGMSGPLAGCFRGLLEQELSSAMAERITNRVRDALSGEELADGPTVRRAVVAALAASVPALASMPKGGEQEDGRPLTLALLGPTGVGKTTTIAKIAAAYKLRFGLSVGLITCDTYRIAAVDQLRTYANIIGLPVRVALTPADVADACESLSECDVILVDTAGRSQRDSEKLEELSRLLDATRPHQRHLVLSAAASPRVVAQAAERFACAKPDCLIATKLDEAVSFGSIIDAAHELDIPLSFVTTGQEVPDEIELPDTARLAHWTLTGVCGTPADRSQRTARAS
jgi:flagellar biosynthesis protein FlhF